MPVAIIEGKTTHLFVIFKKHTLFIVVAVFDFTKREFQTSFLGCNPDIAEIRNYIIVCV